MGRVKGIGWDFNEGFKGKERCITVDINEDGFLIKARFT